MTDLSWLPPLTEWRPRINALNENPATAWSAGVALANTRLDFVRADTLDRAIQKALGDAVPDGLATKPVRLACTRLLDAGAIETRDSCGRATP